MVRKKRISKAEKVKKPKIPIEDKKKVAGFVEIHPELWDLSHKNYKNKNARESAWKEISDVAKLPVDICLRYWQSSLDSLRYTKNKGIKGKSGDGLEDDVLRQDAESDGEDTIDENQLESWDMWDCMKFYVLAKPQRSTMSNSTTIPMEPTTSNDKDDDDDTLSDDQDPSDKLKARKRKKESIYTYAKKSKPQPIEDKLLSSLNDLIAARKTLPSAEDVPGSKLTYLSMYANLDRILKKLPEDTVEDLNMQFTKLAYDTLKACDIIEAPLISE